MKEYERLAKNLIDDELNVSVQEKNILHNFKTHWHEFYEIELILSGNGIYTINGIEHEIHKGDIFFMTPIDFHSVTVRKNNTLRLLNIMFNERFIDEALLFTFLSNKKNTANLQGDSFDNFYFLCKLLENECNMKAYYNKKYIESLINCIIINTIRCSYQNDKKLIRGINSPSQLAAFYIQLHFREQITLNDIANYVGLTPTYISEIFHKSMALTIKSYILELRFSFATKMLLFSDLSITEICYASGFNDFSNFSRAFKNRYHKSPKAYRT